MTAVAAHRAAEWPFVRVALLIVLAVAVLEVSGWLIYESVHEEPTALAQTAKCLRNEKGIGVDVNVRDPIARSADGGALVTTVEGNRVTVSIGSSDREAERIESAYNAVAAALAGRLERRGHTVYLWDFPSSPTQRQVMYDCAY